MKTFHVSDIENLLVQGRTNGKYDAGIPLLWSASCIEVNVTGMQLWFTYECKGTVNGDHLRIEIDGAETSRFLIFEGVHKVCAFMGFGAADIKNVRIYREMQASQVVILIKELHTDGIFHPLPQRPHKIEFVGDSVTSGEGLAGAKSMEVWGPNIFSSRGNYALLVAKELNADYSLVSKSGFGVFCSWDNNPMHSIPMYYEKVCGGTNSPNVSALGGEDVFDFLADRVDIVVVNLGANDAGAFLHDGYIDGDGNYFKMRLDENGKPMESDIRKIEEAIYHFIEKIRTLRPGCTILWCYGMLKETLNDVIAGTIARYSAENVNSPVYSVKLPSHDPALDGSRYHPGAKAHEKYAETIVRKLKELGIA